MRIREIDKDSDLSLVVMKGAHPYCKRHGAMNCNHVEGTKRYYRCYSIYKSHPDDLHLPVEQRRFIDRACEAACIIEIEQSQNSQS